MCAKPLCCAIPSGKKKEKKTSSVCVFVFFQSVALPSAPGFVHGVFFFISVRFSVIYLKLTEGMTLISAIHLYMYTQDIQNCVFILFSCFVSFFSCRCIIKLSIKRLGKLLYITKVRETKTEMLVFARSCVRLRECVCVCECVCGNFHFKKKHNLSITVVEAKVF